MAYSQRNGNERNRGRRRFVQSKSNKVSTYFRNRAASRKRTFQTFQSYQNEAKEYKVSLYRRYRVGDLPDIQILYQDLILPLQALGEKDIEIARALYRILVVAIASASEERPSMVSQKAL